MPPTRFATLARRRASSARRALLLVAAAVAAVITTTACVGEDQTEAAAYALMSGPDKPDVLPKMLNSELPFRYPADLYAKRIQGNVSLRLFIDSLGSVHIDSTRVAESSGYPALDSAAVLGAQALRFSPATLKGRPLNVLIMYPVFFRHPEAAPLPGDTILTPRPDGAAATRPASPATP